MTVLPNTILGGAQKSGTTAVHWLLASHPEIFVPARPQEIHFFDLHENWSKGQEWFAAHFTGHAGEKVITQTSPLYLAVKEVPERIASVLDDVRLLFVLRDPVARAYSHYWHSKSHGIEERSFEEAVALEAERTRQDEESFRNFSYVERGRYATQLARFAECFGRDRILILLTCQLRDEPARVREQLGAFLGIEPAGFGSRPTPRATSNLATAARWPFLQRATRGLRKHVPRLVNRIDRLNLVRHPYPPLADSMRRHLRDVFESDTLRLEREWGLDLARWRR